MQKILDFIHGYQPAYVFKPWFLDNLRNIFLPTSEAMKYGILKRHVQLQGWTIDLGQNSDKEDVRLLTKDIVGNLSSASKKNFIELGFSGYTHPILPLCSDFVVLFQILQDIEVIRTNLGEPTWFWFPEGCVDRRVLKLLYALFPDIIPLIPNMSVDKKIFSGLVKIQDPQDKKKKFRAMVFDPVVKDTLMGASYFEKPNQKLPSQLDWKKAQKSMKEAHALCDTLQALSPRNDKIVVRDWENAGSKDSLIEIHLRSGEERLSHRLMKEVSGFFEAERFSLAEFRLLGELDKKIDLSYDIDKIYPGSWEPLATKLNPYPYWRPSEDNIKRLDKDRKFLIRSWSYLLDTYNHIFDRIIEDHSVRNGSCKKEDFTKLSVKDKVVIAKKVFEDDKINKIFRETSPLLISCFPWHFTTPGEWDNDIGLSLDILKKNITPNFRALISYFEYYVSLYPDKKKLFSTLDKMEEMLEAFVKS